MSSNKSCYQILSIAASYAAMGKYDEALAISSLLLEDYPQDIWVISILEFCAHQKNMQQVVRNMRQRRLQLQNIKSKSENVLNKILNAINQIQNEFPVDPLLNDAIEPILNKPNVFEEKGLG
ncbi:MAG: hypothetical protein V4629_07200 [Pseudomonadota bacterium]